MTNYHTHTFRCRHAEGDVGDYAAAARLAGLTELGFSDHCPWPDGRWPENRMDMADLPSYAATLAAVVAGKSNPPDMQGTSSLRAAMDETSSPVIFSGLECEWVPEYESLMRDEYLGRMELDYLVLGIHNYFHRGEWRDTYRISEASELVSFAETSCEGMESGLFAFLAHPDVYCHSWMPWDENAISCARDILSTAVRTGIPVEINGYGMRKGRVQAPGGFRPPYPHAEFWELAADFGIDCIVNSDAHRPCDTAANLEDGRSLALLCGLHVLERPSMHHSRC
jgi:histidinol-phosphatase (PHP family)